MKMHDRLLESAKNIIAGSVPLDAVEAEEQARRLIEGYELPYGSSEEDRWIMVRAVALLGKRVFQVRALVISRTAHFADMLKGGDAWADQPNGFDTLTEMGSDPEVRRFLEEAVRGYRDLAQALAFVALYRCDKPAAIRMLQSIDLARGTLDVIHALIGKVHLSVGECGVVAIGFVA
jgi:hypothetical protein